MSDLKKVCLITGGARSGKSRLAENRMSAFPTPWIYLATAQAGDEEMAGRIQRHQARRDSRWRTIEEPLQLVDALEDSQDSCGAQLVDCLTLWLSNLMGADRDVSRETDRLCRHLALTRAPVVLVSNEVGMGIVPANPLARQFRDHAGRLNQAVSELAQEVILMVSGIPMTVKPGGSRP